MKFITVFVWFLFIIIHAPAQIPAAQVPAFTFFKPDKSPFTNKQLIPGKMLLFVFFDVGCEHCREAIQYIDKHSNEFKKAAIYLISLDDWDKRKIFMDKYGSGLLNKSNVTMLRDQNDEFITKFGPKKYPAVFLYSAEKKLLLYSDEVKDLQRFGRKIK